MQNKGAYNRAICQLQTGAHLGPAAIENAFLRAKMIMWFATAGIENSVLENIKFIVETDGDAD